MTAHNKQWITHPMTIMTLFFLAVGAPALAFSAEVEEFLGTWEAAEESTLVTSVTIEPPIELFPGFESIKKAQFIAEGNCFHCEEASIIVVRTFGEPFVPSLQVGDRAEYITVELLDAETLKLVVEVYEEPEVCRPPFDCQWRVVSKTPVTLKKVDR